MKLQPFQNHSGFTLAGLMISVAITAIIALGAAYVIVSSQKVGSMSAVQNEIDRLQYLTLQLSRNPAFILKLPGFEKSSALYQCLQHSGPSGVDCTQLRAPASYVTVNKVTGAAGNVRSSIDFQPHCLIPQACDSITLTTSTGFMSEQSKNSSVMSFQPRKSVSTIPGYLLVPMVGFNFSCVQNQGLITALNYGNSQALCQPLAGTLSAAAEPLANFGPVVPSATQSMTKTTCGANGFSSIGSFQDQSNCMIPTVTTTTTMAAPPTTISPPMPTVPSTPTTLAAGCGWSFLGTNGGMDPGGQCASCPGGPGTSCHINRPQDNPCDASSAGSNLQEYQCDPGGANTTWQITDYTCVCSGPSPSPAPAPPPPAAGPGHWVYDGNKPTVAWGDSPLLPGVCGLAPYPCSDTNCSNLKAYIAGAGQTFSIGAGVQLKTYQCGGAGGRAAGNQVAIPVCLSSGGKVNRTVTEGTWICTIP